MSAEHLKSAGITNATATPIVASNPHQSQGVLKESQGVCTPAVAAEANSTYRFCRVPSNARISQVLVKSLDFTTAGAVDIGIYQTAANGGAVVDADLFASALSMIGGPYENLDVTFESTQYSTAESEKQLWEVLGLSADPLIDYDVAATVTTAFDGGQPMSVKVRYV